MGIRLVLLIICCLLSAVDSYAVNSCVGCHLLIPPSCRTNTSSSVVAKDPPLNSCVWCHRGNPVTSRKGLAHHLLIGKQYAWYRLPQSVAVTAGDSLIKLFSCRRCHQQQGKGSVVVTNLDQLLGTADVAAVDLALRQPAFYMPNFQLTVDDRTLLINQILAGGLNYCSAGSEAPQVVYFKDDGDLPQLLFAKHCGACHRVLTIKFGGVGAGETAPNLSGLLSSFYPHTFADNKAWTVKTLVEWVKNPRKSRSYAVMPPIALEDETLKKLIDEVWSSDNLPTQ